MWRYENNSKEDVLLYVFARPPVAIINRIMLKMVVVQLVEAWGRSNQLVYLCKKGKKVWKFTSHFSRSVFIKKSYKFAQICITVFPRAVQRPIFENRTGSIFFLFFCVLAFEFLFFLITSGSIFKNRPLLRIREYCNTYLYKFS